MIEITYHFRFEVPESIDSTNLVQFEKKTQLPFLPPIGTIVTVIFNKGTKKEEHATFEVKWYEHSELSPGIWSDFIAVCGIASHADDLYSEENKEYKKRALELMKNLKKNDWTQVLLE
jgi:hypothetical protein